MYLAIIVISKLNNTDINRKFIAKKIETLYMHSYWETQFERNLNWYSEYFIINKCLIDKRIKHLKIELIHNILPTNENLFKWKHTNSPFM